MAVPELTKEKIALQYCKWCPKACQGLTDEEKIGCLAAGGFADEIALFPDIDRPEREEIASIVFMTSWEKGQCHRDDHWCKYCGLDGKCKIIGEHISKLERCPADWNKALRKADQISAISPDSGGTTCVGLENCCDLEAKIEQAKREERERIIDYLRTTYGEVGTNASRQTAYRIAKQLALDLVLEEVVPLKDGEK